MKAKRMKSVSFNIKIPEDWRTELGEYAVAEERTIAAVVRLAIRGYLERRRSETADVNISKATEYHRMEA